MPDLDPDLRSVARSQRDRIESHERRIGDNKHDLESLREVIDLKLKAITDDISDLRNALKWAGGLVVTLMLSFMAWALIQQYDANEKSKVDLQQQITMIKEQGTARTERRQMQEQLDASTAQPARSARSDR